MKKLTATTVLTGLLALSATAQEKQTNFKSSKLYLRAGLTYGFSHAGNTLQAGVNSGSIISLNGTTQAEQGKASYGAGLYANLAAGYWFTRHLGAELGISAGVLPKKSELREDFQPDQTSSVRVNTSTSAKLPLYLMPSLVLQTGERLNVYSRLGLAVNVAGKLVEEAAIYITTINGATQLAEREAKYSFHTGVGFQGALGVNFRVTRRFGVYTEATGLFMNQYLKQGELTKYSVNGLNQLFLIPTSGRKVEYEMDYSDNGNPPSQNEPSKELSYALPFSYIGISAGITISF